MFALSPSLPPSPSPMYSIPDVCSLLTRERQVVVTEVALAAVVTHGVTVTAGTVLGVSRHVILTRLLLLALLRDL